LPSNQIEWLGRGRHADRIGDDVLAAMTKASATTAAKANLLRIALPPANISGNHNRATPTAANASPDKEADHLCHPETSSRRER
jgi:hypothetical protein